MSTLPPNQPATPAASDDSAMITSDNTDVVIVTPDMGYNQMVGFIMFLLYIFLWFMLFKMTKENRVWMRDAELIIVWFFSLITMQPLFGLAYIIFVRPRMMKSYVKVKN